MRIFVAALGLGFLPVNACLSQEIRNYTGSVLASNAINFDNWLNYDEASCVDRGFVIIQMRAPPRLGKISLVRRKVSSSAACGGRPVSAVTIVYKAGRKAGVDQFSYGVQGPKVFLINASVTVN